jgi:NADPH-dependent curcumin reductase CurA
VLRPKQGEVLFVSAASGAVGALVGQIAAKAFGCVVIGSCGGPDKSRHCKELGFTHVIDYKTVDSAAMLAAKIKSVAPLGIDMNFENVGGSKCLVVVVAFVFY